MEKQLPHSIDAEYGVLGSLIIDPECIDAVAPHVLARDFYRDAHRTIFDAILALRDRREPADFVTICDELARKNALSDAGGASYISSLINGVPTSGNAEYYAHIVAEKAQLRAAIHAAGQVAADAFAEKDSADEVLCRAEQRFFEIAQRHAAGREPASMATLMPSRLERLDYLHRHRGAILGCPTGFTVLDKMTGGLQPSDLIILAARPGVGKTSFALNLAANAALRYGKHVLIFSLEMSKEQLGDRLLSSETGVDQQRMRTGWIEDDEWERLVAAGDKLSESSLWIDDTARISPMEMRSKARRLQATQGCDLVIVDYLQLMRVPGMSAEQRLQEVSEISASLKALARELSVPVLALSQLSRAVEGRQGGVPRLSDLRESGAIEQDADIVAFIYRDDMHDSGSDRRGMADLIIAKHRNGPVGEISLAFEPSRTRFRDVVEMECI